MAEAAGLAGLTVPDDGDLREARAQATARLEDVEDVRRRLATLGEAERDRGHAEQALQKVDAKIEAGERACESAERELAEVRARAEEDLRAWAGRWSGDHPDPVASATDVAVLVESLAHLGRPGLRASARSSET
ncbi:hypothetical protein ACFQX6_02625 [Streptosporangium lutulentum]